MADIHQLCRLCSDTLKSDSIEIFSPESMDNLIGEKIRRYLYFSVSLNDELPKRLCAVCAKKLENIHKFAKMAAEMQEKFRMLLAAEERESVENTIKRPQIKIRSLDELTKNCADDEGPPQTPEIEEVVGGDEENPLTIDESSTVKKDIDDDDNNNNENKENSDDDEEEKPNLSLLHSLLVKGKKNTDVPGKDHDYTPTVNQEVKDEPPDPEDEDIAEEIEEDRLNQIIKDEMESEEEEKGDSDIEITEMEVKVDPMLYFSNTSQSAIEIDDSQDSQDVKQTNNKFCENMVNGDLSKDSSNVIKKLPALTITTVRKPRTAAAVQGPLVMTRSEQKVNPIIASLKMGKPYKCTVCPRSFITDIGLQNHLWSHLPKTKKSNSGATMAHKNVDLEDSQVYSSNGVLHTALPSENPHLLKYACPICGKKISTKGNLKVHLETHRPKGKYGCDICGRVFKTAANLYRHKDYHGGVQFPCLVCGRVYPTNSTLRAHSITHSDLRPHECPLCNKTFKRNQDLKFHINQHTGARPYQCPYCPKAFASSGNCFSHRKRMHPLEVERDKERAAEIMG